MPVQLPVPIFRQEVAKLEKSAYCDGPDQLFFAALAISAHNLLVLLRTIPATEHQAPIVYTTSCGRARFQADISTNLLKIAHRRVALGAIELL